MKILIINLAFEKERMAFQQDQMLRLGLEYERMPAVTANDIPPDELVQIAGQWERPMREVEVACLYSHRAAWKKIARGDQPVLVLEDDALLSSNLPEILSSLEKLTFLDHVTLETHGRSKIIDLKSKKLNETARISRLYQDRTGAAAYVLWPSGASILVERSERTAGLADAIIAAAYEMSSWQIEPAAAIQLDQCAAYNIVAPLETTSTIDTQSTQKPSPDNLLSTMKFRGRRFFSQLRMGLRQLFSLPRAKRRFVAVEINDFQAHIDG